MIYSNFRVGMVAVCMFSGSALAQSLDGFRVSGYGTVGYVRDNRSDIIAIRDISQDPGSNYQKAGWNRDSRLGLQVEYRASHALHLVGQAVFRNQVSTTADDALELAYLAWKPTPGIDARLGRFGYDAFLMSDTRNIGYAYPWVRPFAEYYGWIPMFSVDGIDAAYVIPQDGAQWRLKFQAGRSHTSLPIGTGRLDFKSSGLFNLTAGWQAGPWQVKAGYSRFSSANEVSPGNLATLQSGLATIAAATSGPAPAISAEASTLLTDLSFKNARIRYATLGAGYDDGRWLVQAELANTTSNHKIVPHGTMGYGVIGRRFGNLMPFAAASASRPGNGLRQAVADWTPIGQAATQAVAITVLNSTRMSQRTLTLGARWDFHDQAALKLQWDKVRFDPNGYGLVFKDPRLETQSSRMDQVTLMLDFVF